MTTLGARLDRAEKTLTGRERAAAVYLAGCDDREPDRALLSTMPREQVPEFNRCMGLARGVWGVLGPFLEALACRVDAIETRWATFRVLLLWAGDLEEVADYLNDFDPPEPPATKPRRRDARFRDVRRDLIGLSIKHGPRHPRWLLNVGEAPAPGDGDGDAGFERSFPALWQQVRERAAQCWGQLLAAEAALSEVQAALGSGDALHPAMRGYIDDSRSGLVRLRTEVQLWDRAFEFPGMDEETLDLLRRVIRRSYAAPSVA